MSDIAAAPNERFATRDAESEGGVRALERALRILKCYDIGHPSWSLAELSRAVGLHKATTRRLVKTLEAEGFLRLDPDTGEYRLGSALLPAIYLARSHDELARIAHPHMERLAQRTEETVSLTVWTDSGVLLIDHVLTSHFFKPALGLGRANTQYGTTHSKIHLAFGPPERLSKMTLGDTGSSITLSAATRIHDELESVRKTGIAYDLDERGRGVCAVATPLRDATGTVVASLSVVTPKHRFGTAERASLTALVRETGAQISRELGYKEQAS